MSIPTNRAVVPERGQGMRMRRQESESSQADVADADVNRACLVIGAEHDGLRRYDGGEPKTGRRSIDFAVQAEPLGTADAAQPWADGEPFLMLNNCDNQHPRAASDARRPTTAPAVARFERSAMHDGSNIPADCIRAFAVRLHAFGRLGRGIQTPGPEVAAAAGHVYRSTNRWLFNRAVFDGCRAIPTCVRGEDEIADAARWCTDHGSAFAARPVRAPVGDRSGREDREVRL